MDPTGKKRESGGEKETEKRHSHSRWEEDFFCVLYVHKKRRGHINSEKQAALKGPVWLRRKKMSWYKKKEQPQREWKNQRLNVKKKKSGYHRPNQQESEKNGKTIKPRSTWVRSPLNCRTI